MTSGNGSRPLPVPLGKVVATKMAVFVLNAKDIVEALDRHRAGDWGDVPAEDKTANDVALEKGHRLMSVYKDREGVVFWIVTEADRSVTTVLLPEEY